MFVFFSFLQVVYLYVVSDKPLIFGWDLHQEYFG